jgi:hypothetical protein
MSTYRGHYLPVEARRDVLLWCRWNLRMQPNTAEAMWKVRRHYES